MLYLYVKFTYEEDDVSALVGVGKFIGLNNTVALSTGVLSRRQIYSKCLETSRMDSLFGHIFDTSWECV